MFRCRLACEAWAWLMAAQKEKGCASAAIARRVSIGSKTVLCVSMFTLAREKPAGCDRAKEWLCGLLCGGFKVGESTH